jgi:putative flippase GtrA
MVSATRPRISVREGSAAWGRHASVYAGSVTAVLHIALERLRAGIGLVYREMIKFGVVGGLAFIIDIGLANLLWNTVLEDKVTTAKILSGVAATLFAWVGNRLWTFRHRRSREPLQEVLLFFGVNAIALVIAAGVLALSHYGLGFQSRLADNVATIIGIGLGTVFRFVAYRYFVFAGVVPAEAGSSEAAAERVSKHAAQTTGRAPR